MTTTPPIRRGLALVATMTLSGLGLVACAAPTDSVDPAELTAATNETSAFPLTVDNCGATVELEARPERILTVGTAAVELLDAAGASQYIAARTGEFGAGLPEGLSSPPSDDLIVDPADPTTEQIITSDPDLIYGYGLFNADVEQIRDAGIPVLTVQGECGHDATTEVGERGWLSITDDIRRLGAIFGTQSAAEAAAQEARIGSWPLNVRPLVRPWRGSTTSPPRMRCRPTVALVFLPPCSKAPGWRTSTAIRARPI